jgi:translation initiation factor IF-1
MLLATITEVEPWPWARVFVEVDSGERMRAIPAAAFRLRFPRLRVGDRVLVEPGTLEAVRILRRAG